MFNNNNRERERERERYQQSEQESVVQSERVINHNTKLLSFRETGEHNHAKKRARTHRSRGRAKTRNRFDDDDA